MASRHRFGPWASILTAWATTYPVVEQATYAAEPQAKIQFNLLDIPSGKLVPAMVCIRDLQNNSVRLPPEEGR